MCTFIGMPSTSTEEPLFINYCDKAETMAKFYMSTTPVPDPDKLGKLIEAVGKPKMDVIMRDAQALVDIKAKAKADNECDKIRSNNEKLKRMIRHKAISPYVPPIGSGDKIYNYDTKKGSGIWNQGPQRRRTMTVVNYEENLKCSNTVGYDTDTLTINVTSSVMPQRMQCPKCENWFPTNLYGVLALVEDTWQEHLDECIFGKVNNKVDLKNNILFDAKTMMYVCKKCSAPYKYAKSCVSHVEKCKFA